MLNYSFKHKNERPWPNERLGLAVIIGHTTFSEARIWVRTNDEDAEKGDYQLLVFDKTETTGDDGKTLGDVFEVLRGQEKIDLQELAPFNPHPIPATGEETDTTVVLEVSVKPDVQYSYAIWSAKAGSLVLGHDKRRRFRTPAESGDFAFGLFSCHNPFGKSEEITTKIGVQKMPELQNMGLWNTARLAFENKHGGAPVDFLIAGGDQAYCDGCDALNIWNYLEKMLKKRKGCEESGQGPVPLPSKNDMLSWFRDMYRGYWGFPSVRAVLGRFPTYMIWDDHEIRDGWGSHKIASQKNNELNELLFDGWEDCLSYEDAIKVVNDMFEAAKQAYLEYEHSRNPKTDDDVFDYWFAHKDSLFYVLDGRGHRDFDREESRILGTEQMKRFRKTVEEKTTGSEKMPILFVVSAVPVLHGAAWMIDSTELKTVDAANVTDDLRDAWECKSHDDERRELLDILFQAAGRGIKVCILSGDVHMSAVFRMERDGSAIYQLTSSAITYNTPAALGWFLEKATVAGDGESQKDGYRYRRLLLENEPSFAIVVVSGGEIRYQLYRDRKITAFKRQGGRAGRRRYAVADTKSMRLANSAVKVDLDFRAKET
jgi:alkaline phosphatase D